MFGLKQLLSAIGLWGSPGNLPVEKPGTDELAPAMPASTTGHIIDNRMSTFNNLANPNLIDTAHTTASLSKKHTLREANTTQLAENSSTSQEEESTEKKADADATASKVYDSKAVTLSVPSSDLNNEVGSAKSSANASLNDPEIDGVDPTGTATIVPPMEIPDRTPPLTEIDAPTPTTLSSLSTLEVARNGITIKAKSLKEHERDKWKDYKLPRTLTTNERDRSLEEILSAPSTIHSENDNIFTRLHSVSPNSAQADNKNSLLRSKLTGAAEKHAGNNGSSFLVAASSKLGIPYPFNLFGGTE